MGYRNHMTPMQKTIAYSAIVVGVLAIFSAFASSIHIAYHVFTSSECKISSPSQPKGLLVAGGGSPGSYMDLVELFNPNTGTSCVINGKLDQPRQLHIGDGNLVCGGR